MLKVIENYYNEALLVYEVNPIIFLFLYIITIPVYYYGLYEIVRGAIIFRKKGNGVKKHNLHLYFFEPVFIKGFLVNRFGWFFPYIYVLFFGKNLPMFVVVTIVGWLLISSLLLILKAHGKADKHLESELIT